MASVKRKDLERQLSSIHGQVAEKQKKLLEIQGPRGTNTGRLGEVRSLIETARVTMKALQTSKATCNQDIETTGHQIDKAVMRQRELEKDIEYTDRAQLDSHIAQLERQYQTSNMKLKDEQQLVGYIDKLKRSRKFVDEYQRLHAEVVVWKSNRSQMRDKVWKDNREIHQLKQQCTRHQNDFRELRRDVRNLKSDLGELLKQKRQLLDQNETDRRVYLDQLKPKRTESKKLDEVEEDNDFELFADEKRLCRNLISYLEKFVIVDEDELGDSDVPPLSNCSSGDSNAAEAAVIGVVENTLRRIELGDTLSVSPNRQRKKNSKRDKRRGTQLVPHTPEVFTQFAQLNMNAPSTYADVPIMIARVKEELNYLDQQTSLPLDNESVDGYWTYPSSESGMTDSAMNSFDLSQSDISGYSYSSSRLQSSLAEEPPWETSAVRGSVSCADFRPVQLPQIELGACGGCIADDHSTDMPDGFGRSASDSTMQMRLPRIVPDDCDDSAAVSPINVSLPYVRSEDLLDEGIGLGPAESKSSSVDSSKGPTLPDGFVVVHCDGVTTEDVFELVQLSDVGSQTESAIAHMAETDFTRL